MITTLAVSLVLLGNAPARPHPQTPASQLVSKMLRYYADAQSMTGTITYTATDGGGKVQMVTYLQYEKPSKLFIKQVKGGSQPMQWLVTSDGKLFSYDSPEYLL